MPKKKNKDRSKHKGSSIDHRPAESQPAPRGQVTSRFQQTLFHYGPLPTPEDVEKYNELVKDGAERLFVMAEKQQDHRHQLEKAVAHSNIRNESRGQIFAFILYLTTIGIGALLVLLDIDIIGIVLLVGNTVGFFALYLGSRSSKTGEIESKREGEQLRQRQVNNE